ncbi:MAG: ribokinase [Bacillota bacterium]|jgi:ribokinase|nr:ribokinase [Bacillota bacterium]NLL26052.1 ribokinase [Erysipelotrichia bacterium]
MKILVFSSLNIDHNYYVKNIAKPKETIFASEYNVVSGGKGLNASIALARSGVHVYLAGNIGNDAKILEKVLADNNVDTTYLNKVDEPNGHAIIQIDENGENSIFIYGGSNQSITTEYIDSVLSKFGKGDLLILQNEINNQIHLINKASELGLTIMLNPSPFNDDIYSYPLNKIDYFFINEVEGKGFTNETDPLRILDELKIMYPKAKVVLTLGSIGAYYQDDKQRIFQEAFKVKAIDTVGAGDTFMGYFSYGLSQGFSPEKCLLLATKASSLTVQRKGAADSIPTLKEVNEIE